MKLPAWFIVILVIVAIGSYSAVILLGPQIVAHFETICNGCYSVPVGGYPTPLPDYSSPHGR